MALRAITHFLRSQFFLTHPVDISTDSGVGDAKKPYFAGHCRYLCPLTRVANVLHNEPHHLSNKTSAVMRPVMEPASALSCSDTDPGKNPPSAGHTP